VGGSLVLSWKSFHMSCKVFRVALLGVEWEDQGAEANAANAPKGRCTAIPCGPAISNTGQAVLSLQETNEYLVGVFTTDWQPYNRPLWKRVKIADPIETLGPEVELSVSPLNVKKMQQITVTWKITPGHRPQTFYFALCPVDDATSTQIKGCLPAPPHVDEGGGLIYCPFLGQFNVRMIVQVRHERRAIKTSETITVEE